MTDDVVKRVLTRCRACDNPTLFRYLDLNRQPLANRLLDHPDDESPTVPLIVMACTRCGLSQLSHVVKPEVLFDHTYVYQSGISASWRHHCHELATELGQRGRFVLDLGSNDGTMLHEFADQDCHTLGVDPAASGDGNVLKEFWTHDLARSTAVKADVIIATNVCGHVDSIHDFVAGMAAALKGGGTVVIETPYLPYLFNHMGFDSFYHEHVSYWTLSALKVVLAAHGLRVTKVRFFPKLHEGTIRVYAEHGIATDHDQSAIVEDERRFRDPEVYTAFAQSVTDLLTTIEQELSYPPGGGELRGYGAAAKATVLLNLLQTRPTMVYDDTPTKWGKYIPGVKVPIEQPCDLQNTDLLAVFAWNWFEEIRMRCQRMGFQGKYFVPLPRPYWV